MLDILAHFLHLGHEALGLGQKVGGLGLQKLSCLGKLEVCLICHAQELLTGDGFNSANTACNGAFAEDVERADLCGVIDMRTAAQLHAVITHGDNSDDITVFFTEKCRCA